MSILINLWNWFNGKKTVIGLALMGISTFLEAIVIGKWEATATWIPKVIETLAWIGAALTGSGLLHKGTKAVTSASKP
jgi:hypothetical protein